MRDGKEEVRWASLVPGNFWSSMGDGGFALFARGGPASWSKLRPPTLSSTDGSISWKHSKVGVLMLYQSPKLNIEEQGE